MRQALIATLATALLLFCAAVGLAQQPIPRDTLAARQLEAIAATLRQPVSLPRDTLWLPGSDTVRVFPDAAAVTQRTAIMRDSLERTTRCRTASCRALMLRLLAQIDSLVVAPSGPVEPPTPPVDSQPSPPVPTPPDSQPAPLPPPSGGVAELPRAVPTAADPYPGRACTVTVAGGGNVTTALQQARGGQVVCLTPGASYSSVTLPARSDTGWVVLRTAGTLATGRMRPSRAGQLARIAVPGTSGTGLTAPSGAQRYYVAGLEVVLTGTQSYALVDLQPGSRELVLDRVYVHGTATSTVRRCVSLHSGSTAIVGSWLDDCHERQDDSQAIWGAHGPGPYLIENNTLRGAGENIMFGGDDPTTPGLVPSDITIRGNHIETPVSWKGVWRKKNLFELKNARRVLVEGNVLEGSWGDGQDGTAVVLKSANQSGGCRWCGTADVTWRRNLVRATPAGMSLVAFDTPNLGADSALQRVAVSESVLELGAQPGEARRAFYIEDGLRGVSITRTVSSGSATLAIYIGDQQNSTTSCAFRDNVWLHGAYGVFGSGGPYGTAALAKLCRPGYVWSGITFIGSSEGAWPPGTTFVSSESQVPLAAEIRALVAAATAGVVVPP